MNLIATVLLFSLGISTTSQATECYDLLRKACITDKGNIRWLCELSSESEVSDTLFSDYDKYKKYWEKSDIDVAKESYQRSYRNCPQCRNEAEFNLCSALEKDRYYRTGIRPNSNSSSNQTSNSGSSSNQSSSPQPSTQAESSQSTTNTQTINNKKGKKNPNVVTSKCLRVSNDKVINTCNFSINVSYWVFHAEDQSIAVRASCWDGFLTERLGRGEALSDRSLDTRIFSTACKHPSISYNNKYVSFDEQPEGRCSP